MINLTMESLAFAQSLAVRLQFPYQHHKLLRQRLTHSLTPDREKCSTPSSFPKMISAQPSYSVVSDSDMAIRRKPRRKVAIIIEPTPFTHVSGYSNRFRNLLTQLRRADDDVLVVCPDKSRTAPTTFEGARVVNVPGFRFWLYPRIILSFGFRGVYRELKKFRPDVIHLTTPGFLVFAMLAFARLLRIPLMLSYHTHLPVYARKYGLGIIVPLIWMYLRFVHNRADFTLTTSPQLCEEMISKRIERVGLWRKGIDTNIFHPKFKTKKMREKLTDGHPNDPLIMYIGRIGAEKNLEFFKGLLERFPKCRLALVGDGPHMGCMKRVLKGTKTVFTGLLRGKELASAFASADVFVMPSESETLGFVVMESMASGVPAIGARAGGVPDLITHGKNGFLFKPNNLDDCEKHLKILLEDRHLRERMGKNARKEAEQYGWEASAAAARNMGYAKAIANFKYRAMGGYGLPRSLTWLRFIRRRLVNLKQRLFGQMTVST